MLVLGGVAKVMVYDGLWFLPSLGVELIWELSFLNFWDWVDKVTVQFPRSFFLKPLVSVSNRNR